MKTPRENLLSLLRRQGYETAPCEFMLCPSQVEQFHRVHGSDVDYHDYFAIPWRRLPELRPDADLWSLYQPYHAAAGLTQQEVDEWGVGHRGTPTSMHMTQMYCPLADASTLEEIERYPLPKYSTLQNPDLKQQADALHAAGLASVGNMQCTVWETSWYIRGMESLMMDLMEEDESAICLLDRVTDMAVDRATLYAQAGVDILFLGDDVGMQHTLMMSEDMYVKWLKPRLARVIAAARAIKPDLIVFYHSCGFVEPLIPHFIEAGVDVLNPVQPECMDVEKIIKTYGDRLSFHGTIGTQSLMPFGTPEEVAAEVRRCLNLAGPRGGLLVAPTHLIEPEVPWENIEAYARACKEFTL